MLFRVTNDRKLPVDKLRMDTLIRAYSTIKTYPIKASELLLSNFLEENYGMPLKSTCIHLLLNLTFYTNSSGELVLLFKDPKCERIARIITYGTGVIPGSRILKVALPY